MEKYYQLCWKKNKTNLRDDKFQFFFFEGTQDIQLLNIFLRHLPVLLTYLLMGFNWKLNSKFNLKKYLMFSPLEYKIMGKDVEPELIDTWSYMLTEKIKSRESFAKTVHHHHPNRRRLL